MMWRSAKLMHEVANEHMAQRREQADRERLGRELSDRADREAQQERERRPVREPLLKRLWPQLT